MSEDFIKKLYIEPTSACNLNCSMCFRNNWIEEKIGFMTAETFESILEGVKAITSVKTVMFSGMGEPLIHPDIINMVSKLSAENIKTELLTNATMLSKDMTDELIKAGLHMLWISVDGFDKEAYEKIHKGSEFDTITENIRYFNKVRRKCRLGLTFVIMKDNIDLVKKINSFADEYSFDEINLSYQVPCTAFTKEELCYDSGFKTGKQARVVINEGSKAINNYCPFIEEGNCFVKHSGEVMPCMQLLHSSYSYLYEEKRKIMAKSFGSLKEMNLAQIWASDEYKSFRERVKAFEFPDCTFCDGCDDRLSNETDCMFNTFPTCGACLWAQGVGRCP